MWHPAILCSLFVASPLLAQVRGESKPPPPPREDTRPPYPPPQVVVVETVRPEHETAENVAMAETGGKAVWSRRVELNGSTGGWEVGIRMKGKEQGWKVLIDRDTWQVKRKTAIPNPA